MIEQIEISTLDTRYESFRLKSRAIEKDLLVSISKKGILRPLQGVSIDSDRILLNGFKRYRCAKKLNIGIVPYISFASDAPTGIIELIRKAIEKRLDILEQAKLIEELKKVHRMTNDDIAELLSKSCAWVSLRTNLMRNMGGYVMEKVFSGDFPVYSYMYTLRKFIRIKSVSAKDVDDFVRAVAGKQLSYREIDLLASAFFKGSDEIREQIVNGSLKWTISQLRKNLIPPDDCSNLEKGLLKDMELTVSGMQRLIVKSADFKVENTDFRAQATILTEDMLSSSKVFLECIRRFHDLCTEA